MKIKTNPDDDFPLEKTLIILRVVMLIEPVVILIFTEIIIIITIITFSENIYMK